MRGRDRLAFRSKLGFLFVPGVVEVLVLPVKTNGPCRGGEKNICFCLETYTSNISFQGLKGQSTWSFCGRERCSFDTAGL